MSLNDEREASILVLCLIPQAFSLELECDGCTSVISAYEVALRMEATQ